jgi:hypothetical protein
LNKNKLPATDDVRRAVGRLKNVRPPGPDNILQNYLKSKDIIGITLHTIICSIWKEENIPERWENGLFCPIHRKGNQLELSSYRGITLVNMGYKIVSIVCMSPTLHGKYCW